MPKLPNLARRGAGGLALIFAALAPALSAGGFALSGVAADGVYTRTTPQGLVIAGEGMLIIEETDSASRPTVRTEWKEGEESAVTRWEYSGEGMYPCTRVTTSAEGTRRVAFDAEGNETERALFSAEGALISRSIMEYAAATGERGGHDIASRTDEAFLPTGERASSEGVALTYNEDGSVKTRALYKDGALVKLIQYKGENSWSETVFYEGEAVFTAEFVDGVRVRPGRKRAAGAAAAAER